MLAGHDCYILSDEVYSEMLYGDRHDTVAAHHGLLDRTILVDGFSKTFAMTGWRLGYAALPAELVEPITRLLINSVSCTAPAVQLAGVAALTGPARGGGRDAGRVRAPPKRRRRGPERPARRLLRHAAGRVLRVPQHHGDGLGARAVADRLLDEAGVAVLSGTAFGEYGEGYLRLSYANSLENIAEALAAMGALLEAVAV